MQGVHHAAHTKPGHWKTYAGDPQTQSRSLQKPSGVLDRKQSASSCLQHETDSWGSSGSAGAHMSATSFLFSPWKKVSHCSFQLLGAVSAVGKVIMFRSSVCMFSHTHTPCWCPAFKEVWHEPLSHTLSWAQWIIVCLTVRISKKNHWMCLLCTQTELQQRKPGRVASTRWQSSFMFTNNLHHLISFLFLKNLTQWLIEPFFFFQVLPCIMTHG